MGLVVFASPQGESLEDPPAYTVGDLSPLGALLVGSTGYDAGTPLDLRMEIPGHRAVTVQAKVARSFEHDGMTKVGLEFGELTISKI